MSIVHTQWTGLCGHVGWHGWVCFGCGALLEQALGQAEGQELRGATRGKMGVRIVRGGP